MSIRRYVSKAGQDDAGKPGEWRRLLHIAVGGTVAIIATILLGDLGAAVMTMH